MGKKTKFCEKFPPKIINKGIRMVNSSEELIKQEIAMLNGNISRGIFIFVTRFDLPTMALIVDVVPIAKNRQVIKPVSK
jgi:hypothetical protein